MNLAFFTNEYPHEKTGKSGGIGTSIKNLAQSYLQLGNKVYVFVCYGNFDSFDDNGIKIIAVNSGIKLRGLLGVYLKRKEIEHKTNNYIKLYGIDYIEVADWAGIAAFINFNCKKVVKFHGSDAYFCQLEGRKQKMKNYFYEFLNIKNADIFISVSKYAAELTKSIFHLKNKEINIIYNGIYLNYFTPTEQYKTDKASPVILYLGTLIRKKGCLEIPLIFNEVLKLRPDTKLIIAGKDTNDIATGNISTWEMMKPLFNNISQVDYVGPLPHDEVKNIISQADVCIYPSYAEAFPMTWLEAMAMQKAIVASDIGWANEMIEDGKSGYLVNPKNHQLFAEKIVKITSDINLQKQLGIQARKVVEERFDIKNIAIQHIEIFNNYK